MTADAHEVKTFYDDFLESRLIDYRIHGNLRIQCALARILEYVTVDSMVIDVGCGIGIVTEAIGGVARKGKVWGCDISARNIWYAERTIEMSNVHFRQIDVLREYAELRAWIGYELVDLIVLVDVIEHLPSDEVGNVLRILGSFLKPDGRIVLTYPSPQYQQYLYDENPAELQIIDEKIELAELARLAVDAGLAIIHFSLEDVWRENQYAHCVLEKHENVSKLALIGPERPSIIRRFRAAVDHRVLLPVRRRKYVDDVFGTE